MKKSNWEIYLEEKKEREERLEKVSIIDLLDKDKYSKDNFVGLIELNYRNFFKDRIVETGFKKAFKENSTNY